MTFRFLIVMLFFFLFDSINCNAKDPNCFPSSCGKIHNISYPFRLNTDPKNCGHKHYVLSCETNTTVLHLGSGKYLVELINYDNKTVRIVDSNIKKGNCASLPSYSLSEYNFSMISYQPHVDTNSIVFVSCENPVKSPRYIDTSPCTKSALSPSKRHSYVLVNGSSRVSDMVDACGVELMAMVSRMGNINGSNVSFFDIHNELAYGFELSWFQPYDFESTSITKTNGTLIMSLTANMIRMSRFNFSTLLSYTLSFILPIVCKTIKETIIADHVVAVW